MLAIYSKSFLVKPYKIFSIDLATNIKDLILPLASGNLTYICVIVETKYYQKSLGVQECYTNTHQLDVFNFNSI